MADPILNAVLEDHWENFFSSRDLATVINYLFARLQNGEDRGETALRGTRVAVDILSFLHPLTVVDIKLSVLSADEWYHFGCGRGKFTYDDGEKKLTFTCRLQESSRAPGKLATDYKYLFTWFRRVHATFVRVNVEIKPRGVKLDLPDWLKASKPLTVPTLLELTRYWFVKRGLDHRKPVLDNWEHFVPRTNCSLEEGDSGDEVFFAPTH